MGIQEAEQGHVQELHKILEAPDVLQHYGVPINTIALAALYPVAADALLTRPRQSLAVLDQGLQHAQRTLLAQGDLSPSATLKVVPPFFVSATLTSHLGTIC